MKKIIIAIVGLIMTQMSSGQVFTMKVGTSFSTLDWKLFQFIPETPYNGTLIGFTIYTGVDYVNKKHLNLSSNIGYIERGGKGEIPLTDQDGDIIGSVTSKPELNYISLNTTVDFKYPIKESIIPFVSIGPRLDFLINYSNHFDGIEDLKDFNKTYYGLILGGGVKYDFTKFQLGLRFDYYQDFKKVAEWPQGTGISGGEISTNTISTQLSFGYRFE